jgi:hypothetical protein
MYYGMYIENTFMCKCVTTQTTYLHLFYAGYQWWKSQRIGSAQILKVDPKGKFTILGSCSPPCQIDQIWIVESSSNTLTGPLIDLAKQRLKTRGSPSFSSFDDFKKVRQSCWIIEESGGEFFCDCPVCMKVNEWINAYFVNIFSVCRVS